MGEDEKQLYSIILRHDTSTNWMANNPILSLGEYGVEDDTHKVKRGNGENKWSDIPYEDFGLKYIVTFENLHGDVKDNAMLQKALDTKVSLENFSDVKNTVISGIMVTDGDKNAIGKIIKTAKDIEFGSTTITNLIIKSGDNSIQGIWSLDEKDNKVLNLTAKSTITNYKAGVEYCANQLCYHNNKLYRAINSFTANETFNPEQWTLIASLTSSDIKYDNMVSNLDADTVKLALDELARRDSKKVQKSTETRIVYGTTSTGEQTVYNIDDLRKVDTINNVLPDRNKNIQIDATKINYNDAQPEQGNVKDVLDSKVDKIVAGKGALIVKDVKVTYNEDSGDLELQEEKVSLEDGKTQKEISKINVVSEIELNNNVKNINNRIDEEVETLNTKIDTTKSEINQNIADKETNLNNRITEEVNTLNQTIDNKDNTTNERITNEVNTLNNKIDENKTNIETKLDTVETDLNNKIVNNKADIETKLLDTTNKLNKTIAANKTDIEDKLNATKNELNGTIAGNKIDIENKLNQGLDTKIDRDIADNIVTDIAAATDSEEPTLRVIRKNTTSEQEIIHHLHFKAKGKIKTKFGDADHIVIDSSEIDKDLTNHNTRIENTETRLDAHDTEIAALQVHDANHDEKLAAHTEQIALHETDIAKNKKDIKDLDNKITDVKAVNAKQELHLTEIDTQLDTHTEQLQNQADQIGQVAETVSNNRERLNILEPIVEQNKVDTDNNIARIDESLNNLSTSKVDKTLTDNIITNLNLVAEENNLLNMKIDAVNPQDTISTTKNIILKSSDNTLVSKPILGEDGTILGYDLATNLDIDVNYFVTSETLNTTIPSDTTIQISSLTSTDKPNVELQDIISDAEGTWARVKSIDTDKGTLVCVTYHKHAQAIWGTVKGNIAEQTDLKTELDKAFPKSYFGKVFIKSLYGRAVMEGDPLAKGYASDIEIRSDLSYAETGLGYVGKTILDLRPSESVKLWNIPGLDGPRVLFNVNAEGVEFDKKESGLTSTKLADSIRELKTLDDAKLQKTSEVNKVYGTDELGNQFAYDKTSFGKVDTVNSIEADETKNIEIWAEDIPCSDMEDPNIESSVYSELQNMYIKVRKMFSTLLYVPLVWDLDKMFKNPELAPEMVLKNGDYIEVKGENNVIILAKVIDVDRLAPIVEQCGGNFMTLYEVGVKQGLLYPIGIPEQIVPSAPEPSTGKLKLMANKEAMRSIVQTMESAPSTIKIHLYTPDNPNDIQHSKPVDVGIFDVLDVKSEVLLRPDDERTRTSLYEVDIKYGTPEEYINGTRPIIMGVPNPAKPQDPPQIVDGEFIPPEPGQTAPGYEDYIYIDIPQIL